MKKDKLRLYILEIFLILFLIFTLFSTRLLTNKLSVSIFLVLYAFIVRKNIKSSKAISIHSIEVTKYMIIFAFLYLALYYLIGLYVGYYKATYNFGFWTLFNQILPIVLIICSSEVLRKEFLSDKRKLSLIITFIFGVLVDLVIYTNIYNLSTLAGFLEAMGYVFFASLANNLLYNYVCVRFGIKPNIIYRIITTIYLYIIPITPDVHMYFKTFARIIFPIIILLVLFDTYEKKNQILTVKNKKFRIALTAIMITIVTLFTMLISCRFKYGLIVIGSNSMFNVLEKGDAVVFDTKYNNLNEGMVVLYKKDRITIVHRIIRIEDVNGEKRFYTKGDNNSSEDEGYRTYDNIIGVVNLKVKRIGLPTIWINELFNK